MRELSQFEKDFVKKLPYQVGAKVKLTGPVKDLVSLFVKSEADYALEEGKLYTIESIEPASSWTAVTFEEVPNKTFPYHWFTK